eukprot:scaffold2865_cov69-Phaeocystis_antarctica.AAC.1
MARGGYLFEPVEAPVEAVARLKEVAAPDGRVHADFGPDRHHGLRTRLRFSSTVNRSLSAAP